MPFDVGNDKLINRALLIDALRTLPPDFEWNFQRRLYATPCGSAGCAVGLAAHIGLIPHNSVEPFRETYRALGLSNRTGDSLFGPVSLDKNRYRRPMEQVSAAMVADALEKVR